MLNFPFSKMREVTHVHELERIKITVVGDGYAGKTSLVEVFKGIPISNSPYASSLDPFTTKITVDGNEHNVDVYDTHGQEDYARLRQLMYDKTSIFLVCFAVNERRSFRNVQAVWLPELKEHCPAPKIILVATRIDLRSASLEEGLDAGEKEGLVTSREGRKKQAKIGAVRYMECSAKNGVGVTEVFAEAVRCVLNERGRGPQKSPCALL